MREFVDRQKEQFALILARGTHNTKLVVFVHGFEGSYLGTWGDLATIIRKNAAKDPVLSEWDFLFFGYDTPTAPSLLSVARRLSAFCGRALNGEPPFHNPYGEIALIGHSLGTLVIRQLLCATSEQPSGFAKATRRVLLFGSPVSGSWLARFGKGAGLKHIFHHPSVLLPGHYAIAQWLRPDGPFLETLRSWHRTMVALKLLPPVRLRQGTGDKVVGYAAVDQAWEGDDRLEIDSPHLDMVVARSADWHSCRLRDEILAVLK